MSTQIKNKITHFPKNQLLLILFIFLNLCNKPNALIAQPEAFITTWKTSTEVDPSSSIVSISTVPGLLYDYEVDWNNDGIYDQKGLKGSITHNFGNPGVYTIRIKGVFPGIQCRGNSGYNELKLISIDQWGSIAWETMENAFAGCANLTYAASDVPDLRKVKSLKYMFNYCRIFDGSIGSWDVSNVENMEFMFLYCDFFNGNIGKWNVSKVTNMSGIFYKAISFNQDISKWNVSNVKLMQRMFNDACMFNQNIDQWNVSNVTDMSFMFAGATSFNSSIGSWDVSNVTNMSSMFAGWTGPTNFNQDISKWNVSNVTDMSYMFYVARSFNQDISNWNVSKVKDMHGMFAHFLTFNQDLSKWDVSNVTDMNYMFYEAVNFNQDLSKWNVSNVTNMQGMFFGTNKFNSDLSKWNVSKVTNMKFVFRESQVFNEDISNWDVSSVKEMSGMFDRAISFNQNLAQWNLTKIVALDSIFRFSGLSCTNYDKTLIGWSNNLLTPDNINFLPIGMKYYNSKVARDILINNKHWTINGDSYSFCNSTNTPYYNSENNFGLYYDSNTDILRIEFQTSIEKGSEISLLDISGKRISDLYLSPGTPVLEINISKCQPGIYFVKLSNQGQLIATKKLTKY